MLMCTLLKGFGCDKVCTLVAMFTLSTSPYERLDMGFVLHFTFNFILTSKFKNIYEILATHFFVHGFISYWVLTKPSPLAQSLVELVSACLPGEAPFTFSPYLLLRSGLVLACTNDLQTNVSRRN